MTDTALPVALTLASGVDRHHARLLGLLDDSRLKGARIIEIGAVANGGTTARSPSIGAWRIFSP